MKLLLVAATAHEIQPFIKEFGLRPDGGKAGLNDVQVLITGVGMVATAFSLGKFGTTDHFDLAINAGIAGAFDKGLQIGELVNITQDEFAELGAEDGDQFLRLDDLDFGTAVFRASFDAPFLKRLTSVSSITVNKVHGSLESIKTTLSRITPQTESMEGAAFFYACDQLEIPSVQIRSISNYVERRNRENWNIPLAIKNLNETLIEIITKL